ncbi:MAG: hypothetical protein ACI9SP_001236 [Arenicella sp.]|jgi:hypothetical protein
MPYNVIKLHKFNIFSENCDAELLKGMDILNNRVNIVF